MDRRLKAVGRKRGKVFFDAVEKEGFASGHVGKGEKWKKTRKKGKITWYGGMQIKVGEREDEKKRKREKAKEEEEIKMQKRKKEK